MTIFETTSSQEEAIGSVKLLTGAAGTRITIERAITNRFGDPGSGIEKIRLYRSGEYKVKPKHLYSRDH